MISQFFKLSVITFFVLFFSLSFLTQSSFSKSVDSQNFLSNSSTNENILNIYLISKVLEREIEKVSAIIDIASKIPDVRNIPYANLLNKSTEIYNGIPEGKDIKKREIFKDILSKYPDISAMTLLMPNGDVYAEEPFSLQENLTDTNFAFRDYFKGAIDSKNMFMGDLIISAATGLPITVIAVPIYSDNKNENNLTGILLGILDFVYMNKFLQSINFSNSERMMFLDHFGNTIYDSYDIDKMNQSLVFSNLQSFQNAISGISGSIIEPVNNTKMIISYYPVKAVQNTWVILSMKPYYNN